MTASMRARLRDGRVDSYHNAALIEELRRLRVPSTLFLSGLWMEEYPEVTRSLAADPLFELGTHTWSHRAFTPGCYTLAQVPRSEMLSEVTRAMDLLEELAGPRATPLFRFPGGCYDAAALEAIAPSGAVAVQFDVAGGDGFQLDASRVVDQVVSASRGGSVVVLHMNGANTSPRTDEALPGIVSGLRARGFEFATVGRLLGVSP